MFNRHSLPALGFVLYRLRFLARCSAPLQRAVAATLTLIAATMLIAGLGIGSIDQAKAAPMCPGVMTVDGLACCPQGATPTGADTCELPGAGVAAACTLSQLSYGTCCPLSSVPYTEGDGSAASACLSNGWLYPGCALSQLGRSGQSCCPTGQEPQADGSCAPPVAVVPSCPPGLEFYGSDCQAFPIGCPAGTRPLPLPGEPNVND